MARYDPAGDTWYAMAPNPFGSVTVEYRHACRSEIPDVMRGDRKAVCQGGRGDHAVEQGYRLSLFPQAGDELCPALADGSIPRQTVSVVEHCLEPSLKLRALTPTWEQEDAKSNLAKNHRVYDEIAFVRTQSSDHLGIGSVFGRLTQDVRIKEISHPIFGTETSSVDSVRLAG